MPMLDTSQISSTDPLPELISSSPHVGTVFRISYEKAFILTNDDFKVRARGVPNNCFLLACSFTPANFGTTREYERVAILLRVVGACAIPQDDDMVRMRIERYQEASRPGMDMSNDLDDVTTHLLQFGGLECRVLGTFYQRDGAMLLGSDVESFTGSGRLEVYKPIGEALRRIVSYIDPIRQEKARQELEALGITVTVPPFQIGTVRYTSTAHLHRSLPSDLAPVSVQPTDFLARRTAVLGMTRTGKSNMVKQMVSVVMRVSKMSGMNIGQIIYDPNGEYSNANRQDQGAISEVFPNETIRYRAMPAQGFESLLNDFYSQLQEGYNTICAVVKTNPAAGKDQPDIKNFIEGGLDFTPLPPGSYHLVGRRQRMEAIYRVLLNRAGFLPPPAHSRGVTFQVAQEIYDAVIAHYPQNVTPPPLTPANRRGGTPTLSMSYQDASTWFEHAYEVAGSKGEHLVSSSSGSASPWFDETCLGMLRLILQKNASGSYINGYRNIQVARQFHAPGRTVDVCEEIYQHLIAGRIVILDLSVGPAEIRERLSKDIAQHIFNRSMGFFTAGDFPPSIVVYVEEAHNLIGKNAELTETWPRLAKEGAKFRIALVYSTQEPSSVHRSILSATENWVVTHLNNDNEIREVSKFYDFSDFSASLHRAQDVGFARVKTLSSPYVVPVQIDRFDPDRERDLFSRGE